MTTDQKYTDKASEVYFSRKYQDACLDVETAMLIDIAINNLLKKDSIFRNENIPKEEQVINEQDHILNNQEDDEFYQNENPEEDNKEDGIQNDENLDTDDLQQRND